MLTEQQTRRPYPGLIVDPDADFLLTTTDNPYDPFEEWGEWVAFDNFKGYHTPQLLDRVLATSDELSEKDENLAFAEACESIIHDFGPELYTIAYRNRA